MSEYREYERTLTAVLNSYVQPQVTKYVDHLESQLRDEGFSGRFNIVRSDGGTMSAKATRTAPSTSRSPARRAARSARRTSRARWTSPTC